MQLWCLWRGRGVNNKGPESSGIIRTSHLAGAREAFWSLTHPSVESAEATWKFYYISNLEPSYCFSWPVIGPGGTKPLTFEVSPSALFKAQKESCSLNQKLWFIFKGWAFRFVCLVTIVHDCCRMELKWLLSLQEMLLDICEWKWAEAFKSNYLKMLISLTFTRLEPSGFNHAAALWLHTVCKVSSQVYRFISPPLIKTIRSGAEDDVIFVSSEFV